MPMHSAPEAVRKWRWEADGVHLSPHVRARAPLALPANCAPRQPRSAPTALRATPHTTRRTTSAPVAHHAPHCSRTTPRTAQARPNPAPCSGSCHPDATPDAAGPASRKSPPASRPGPPQECTALATPASPAPFPHHPRTVPAPSPHHDPHQFRTPSQGSTELAAAVFAALAADPRVAAACPGAAMPWTHQLGSPLLQARPPPAASRLLAYSSPTPRLLLHHFAPFSTIPCHHTPFRANTLRSAPLRTMPHRTISPCHHAPSEFSQSGREAGCCVAPSAGLTGGGGGGNGGGSGGGGAAGGAGGAAGRLRGRAASGPRWICSLMGALLPPGDCPPAPARPNRACLP